MSNSQSTDVLIVGAGPVGLALALGLARDGVNCRIIERDPDFRDRGVRGKGVTPRTMEVFDDLGVVDEIYARADVNLKMRTYEGSRLVSETDPAPANLPTPDRPHLGVIMLAQHHTEAVLRKRLADYGVTVELGTSLTHYTQTDDEVIATVQQTSRTEQFSARYLVGCDGGRSTVRKVTGIPFLGETWDEERFLMGSVRIDGLDPRCMHVWNDPDLGAGALVLVPMTCDGTWAFHASVAPDENGELPTPSLANFRRLFAERAALPGVALHDLVWSTIWRPTVRMVERYRTGRVFLAGDAAHCHSAAGGQGMNTGIQDAHNLSWKLAAALRGAPDSLLDSYQAERLPVGTALLAATSAQHRALFDSQGAEVLAKQFNDATGTASGADLTGLSIHYQGSLLSHDLDHATGIRAGDRAPDAPCRTADGADIRLFDLFRGPHFTLLAFGKPLAAHLPGTPGVRTVTVDDTAGAEVLDTYGHARRAYGVTGEATVLVRPDGYVALTAGPVGPQPVASYLDELAPAEPTAH
ncbi:FAD-dependent monooxygenase [Streptomyces sp. x-19]|uniref:FAD-dependent monooxygenase n=1 Tax=Streptomyces sp. x-19 TaxID=2789280 RepID=UPI00397F7924